ncbi:glycoside hydrolase family 5 protein [Gonapodya prolifera JEL478]|uniref:glucan 1,3-beta-glucosidase n=1 Tax=Gonapodya prolifera (strain JEL478) TaxID=1344416 RepID=A0A139AT12_GONPJ|nr:glycoside hydrolase family 5 protein [Gonapodya prolifera JEL478]|eukprot:KXS19693.1 glycoside hydrolase family 5 protein [Gonapodya prolifera JEL478]
MGIGIPAGVTLSVQDISDWILWSCLGWYDLPIAGVPVPAPPKTCDLLNSNYLAGYAPTSEDLADWATWGCAMYYPTGIGGRASAKTCDAIYAKYVSGQNVTAEDWQSWSFWSCVDWFPQGIGSIQGVALGGWISPEPFIAPSVFQVNGTLYQDLWSMCTAIGRPACESKLSQHFDTFITEQDIQEIKSAGFNYVRIPFNYWDVSADLSEPYPANIGWAYVDRVIGWCSKYGLQVGLGVHAMPGGQNPWNHAGHQDQFGWLTNFAAYSQRSTATLIEVVKRIKGPNYTHVRLLELVNEPYLVMVSADTVERVRGWYRSVIVALRSLVSDAAQYPSGGPELMISESFLGSNVFYGERLATQGLTSAYLDYHFYSIFVAADIAQSPEGHIQQVASVMVPNLLKMSVIAPTFVGEFSAAMTDCAPYLNGVGGGSRYDGSFAGFPNVCGGCMCADAIDVTKWTDTQKTNLRAYVDAQIKAARAYGVGFVFWTWKTETRLVEWDWKFLVERGMASLV